MSNERDSRAEFSGALKRLRLQRQLTQIQLANATGYSRSLVAHAESGRSVSPDFVANCERVLDSGGQLTSIFETANESRALSKNLQPKTPRPIRDGIETPRPSCYVFGGRFQPFHKGHLEVVRYLLSTRMTPLVVGIVNPDPKNQLPGDSTDWIRFNEKDNPFSYWERVRLIAESLKDLSDDLSELTIVPLPRPSVNIERANNYLPLQPRCFVLCRRWGDEVEEWKSAQYKKNGDQVAFVNTSELPELTQLTSATLIRSLIRLGNPHWQDLVADSARNAFQELGIVTRLFRMTSEEEARTFVRELLENHPLSDTARRLLEL